MIILIKASRTSKFSKENGDFQLVFQEDYLSRVDAMRREKQLKGLTRAKEEPLISGNLESLIKL